MIAVHFAARSECGSKGYRSKKGGTMSSRKLFLFSIVAVLCLSRLAFSQAYGTNPIEVGGGATARVIKGKSHSAQVEVKDAEGSSLMSIPVEAFPSIWIYSKSANTLYLVHEDKKSGIFISPVNLTTQRAGKDINIVGRLNFNLDELIMSSDGSRLFFDSPGRSIYAIDTASNQVVATYNYDWFRDLSADRPKHSFINNHFVSDGEGGHLIAISEADPQTMGMLKPLKCWLTVLSANSSHPPVTVDPGGPVVASMFSKDGKLLIGADKSTEGSLAVVDLDKGTSVNHALTDHPTRLFRLGSKQEPWVLGNEEMRSISETGELGDRRIPLNKPVKGGESGETGASAFLDGFPGETLSLGDEHAAIQITNKHGGSRHKVALVDMKKLQVDAIIPTMSGGEIAGIRVGRFAAAYAMSMATGGAIIFTPNFIRNESLAARPDGRFLFALDLEGHVITVVDVQTATVVRRIRVNNTITRIELSSDGKHLICFGNKTQQINLESNNLEN
jgi:hypothetical protein